MATEYTKIGKIQKRISRIGLGTWAIGGWMWGGTEEKEAIAAIHKAFEMGVTLVDTAPVYGFGRSEEIVGKALKTYPQKGEIVIATKVGLAWHDSNVWRDSSPQRIAQEIEDSLRRLHVDVIDLYQVHWPDEAVPFEETGAALHKLLDAGKIRTIGVSNYTVAQMDAFRKGAPLHANQSLFNLFERETEKDILPYGKKHGLAQLGYSSLCRGLLSEKMRKGIAFRGDDLRKTDPKFQEPHFSEYLRAVERLKEWVMQKHRRTILALAVRWTLDMGVDVALWGARKPEQLEHLTDVWGWKLNQEDVREIDQIIKETIPHPVMAGLQGPPQKN